MTEQIIVNKWNPKGLNYLFDPDVFEKMPSKEFVKRLDAEWVE